MSPKQSAGKFGLEQEGTEDYEIHIGMNPDRYFDGPDVPLTKEIRVPVNKSLNNSSNILPFRSPKSEQMVLNPDRYIDEAAATFIPFSQAEAKRAMPAQDVEFDNPFHPRLSAEYGDYLSDSRDQFASAIFRKIELPKKVAEKKGDLIAKAIEFLQSELKRPPSASDLSDRLISLEGLIVEFQGLNETVRGDDWEIDEMLQALDDEGKSLLSAFYESMMRFLSEYKVKKDQNDTKFLQNQGLRWQCVYFQQSLDVFKNLLLFARPQMIEQLEAKFNEIREPLTDVQDFDLRLDDLIKANHKFEVEMRSIAADDSPQLSAKHKEILALKRESELLQNRVELFLVKNPNGVHTEKARYFSETLKKVAEDINWRAGFMGQRNRLSGQYNNAQKKVSAFLLKSKNYPVQTLEGLETLYAEAMKIQDSLLANYQQLETNFPVFGKLIEDFDSRYLAISNALEEAKKKRSVFSKIGSGIKSGWRGLFSRG